MWWTLNTFTLFSVNRTKAHIKYLGYNIILIISAHVNNGNGLRVSELAVKITRRIKQHVYAESIYSGNLLYSGYEEMVLLIKIVSKENMI